MSDNEFTVEEIEISKEHAEKMVAYGDAFKRLSEDKDFREVIFKGYFEDEAARLVMLRANPSMQADDMQQSIDKSIDAIGYLYQYFNGIKHNSEMAAKSIIDCDIELEHMRTQG